MKSEGENEGPGNCIQNCSRNWSAQIRKNMRQGQRCCLDIYTDLFATEESNKTGVRVIQWAVAAAVSVGSVAHGFPVFL